jgi:hypothetical protein
MYLPVELARFALSEFERGLEGLTDDEARMRLPKGDGGEMNSISWTAGHIAWHWGRVRWMATDEPYDPALDQFANGSPDPTPPSLERARHFLAGAAEGADWIASADDALMARVSPEKSRESVGTALMRVVLHTWFHAGEINAMRQTLGHPEIVFVGRLLGSLEWRSPAE